MEICANPLNALIIRQGTHCDTQICHTHRIQFSKRRMPTKNNFHQTIYANFGMLSCTRAEVLVKHSKRFQGVCHFLLICWKYKILWQIDCKEELRMFENFWTNFEFLKHPPCACDSVSTNWNIMNASMHRSETFTSSKVSYNKKCKKKQSNFDFFSIVIFMHN